MDIRFIAGKSNAVADWLSRSPDIPIGTAYALQDQEAKITALEIVAL